MSSGSVEPCACDLLVRNALVVTMDPERRVFRTGALAIGEGRILAVGPERELAGRYGATRAIDAGGGIVHPGLIESHVHPNQQLIRFAFPDTFSYPDTLGFYIEFLLAIDEEDEYASTLLACLEMVRNGATCFLEGCGSVLEPDAAAAAIEAVGMRGSLGDPYIWDIGGEWAAPLAKRIPPDLGRALDLLGGQLKRNRDEEALVRGHVAMTGHATASDELELAAKACADEHGAILNQHQSYAASDTSADDELRGQHPLAHFGEIGVLGENCTFAHMNLIRDDEVEPVTASGLSIVWCPTASMLWGAGGTFRGRHVELFRRGANVALGSDASCFAGSLDVGEQAFLAVLTARERSGETDVLLAEDALAMATVNGAQALGMADEIGSLEVGKRADVVVRRTDLPEWEPATNPIRNLIFASRSKSVDTVIVNGEVIVEGGHSMRVDERAVYRGAAARARRLLTRIGRDPEWRWPVIE
ncbi:MAG: amidohydrolase family protein [Actinomycetia bacterium]|nr:amidohydrolase family protein [Actinomycetes bacterium]